MATDLSLYPHEPVHLATFAPLAFTYTSSNCAHAPFVRSETYLDFREHTAKRGVQEAKAVHKAEPMYPPLAKQARIQGTVRLEAVIAADGSIQNLRVLEGHPLLVQSALQAVQQWRYQPTLLSGEPVEVVTFIEVVFRLY